MCKLLKLQTVDQYIKIRNHLMIDKYQPKRIRNEQLFKYKKWPNKWVLIAF